VHQIVIVLRHVVHCTCEKPVLPPPLLYRDKEFMQFPDLVSSLLKVVDGKIRAVTNKRVFQVETHARQGLFFFVSSGTLLSPHFKNIYEYNMTHFHVISLTCTRLYVEKIKEPGDKATIYWIH
jgi:hypothetical protein